MATLTEAAYYTRRGLFFFFAAIIGFFVTRASVHSAVEIYRHFFPPPPPKPTVAFGKLPPIQFPASAVDPFSLTYRQETIEATFPAQLETGRVYAMPGTEPSFLQLDRAKQKAQGLGFKDKPILLKSTLYRWEGRTEPPTLLEMDINTGNFTLRYPWSHDPALAATGKLISSQRAISEAKGFLNKGGFLEEDLAEGTAEFELLKFSPPDLYPALSLQEANFIRINLFRTDLDELRIMPPNPKKALVTFLFSSQTDNKKIVEADYTYFPIERETFATYPLKTVQKAWEELQNGLGYIAYLGQDPDNEVVVRNAFLAYFDAGEKQPYLQPIFVFEGDYDFYGYIPAVSPEWWD